MENLEQLDFLLELAEVFGMGSINVLNFNQKDETHNIIIKNANKNKVSCHHTRGYLASIFSSTLNKTFECKENECISEGAEACKFTIYIKD